MIASYHIQTMVHLSKKKSDYVQTSKVNNVLIKHMANLRFQFDYM